MQKNEMSDEVSHSIANRVRLGYKGGVQDPALKIGSSFTPLNLAGNSEFGPATAEAGGFV